MYLKAITFAQQSAEKAIATIISQYSRGLEITELFCEWL